MCCNPWCCKESYMTEWLNWTDTYNKIFKNLSTYILKLLWEIQISILYITWQMPFRVVNGTIYFCIFKFSMYLSFKCLFLGFWFLYRRNHYCMLFVCDLAFWSWHYFKNYSYCCLQLWVVRSHCWLSLQFIHFIADGHLNSLHFLVFLNSASRNIFIYILW